MAPGILWPNAARASRGGRSAGRTRNPTATRELGRRRSPCLSPRGTPTCHTAASSWPPSPANLQ
eukprot:6704464-Lingulodinium_polyedra.AAC.1